MGIICWALTGSAQLQDKASNQGPGRGKVWPHGPRVGNDDGGSACNGD